MPNWKTMSALLSDVPALDGAACKGRADLYERTVGEWLHAPTREARARLRADREAARTAALAICHGCPALAACRTWLDGERPTRRPRGVVAGRLVDATNP